MAMQTNNFIMLIAQKSATKDEPKVEDPQQYTRENVLIMYFLSSEKESLIKVHG